MNCNNLSDYSDSKLMSQKIINSILDFFDLNDANVLLKKIRIIGLKL